ncbi:MAG: tRNA(m5U54)methyltransferase [Pycnora praestabilis]|nr:MAG: tRNA(m5U54)methyltransferase [Pycnora praestabilis]
MASSAVVAQSNTTAARNPDSKTRSNESARPFKKRKIQQKPFKEGSVEEVLLADVRHLIASHENKKGISDGNSEKAIEELPSESKYLPVPFMEIDIDIIELSSTGDGLGFVPGSKDVSVVPFTAPGDKVTAKLVKRFKDHNYWLSDFVKIVSPSSQRDDSRIKCPYFANCSGCQFQMLAYDDQLAHKKTIVEKAYRNFSGLPQELVPAIGNTIGSPMQYGYRTKLTPHFDGPPGSHSRSYRKMAPEQKGFEEVPSIGFMKKGTRKTLDIEDCPIGTDAVRKGMKSERKRVAEELTKYKRGATLLLRENTTRTYKVKNSERGTTVKDPRKVGEEEIPNDASIYTEEKICMTDPNGTSTEYVDDFVFSNKASEFFQNNNSILPRFTAYIREHILPSASLPTIHASEAIQKPIKYLIDAYSGSGLFTITLSSLFSSSMGIDISAGSIASARLNAKQNNVSNATFIAADAPTLFADVTYPPDQTVVVVDPPRKGCDESFLKQLMTFAPKRVVYVSCNVHTQARDVGVLVGGEGPYDIESLRGFDFFPQTGHVEGVAILRIREGLAMADKMVEETEVEGPGSGVA